MKKDIRIRNATPDDFPILAGLERKVWEPLGTPVYTRAHFEAWYETYQKGFFVAEFQGGVVGYTNGIRVNWFDPHNLSWLTSYDEMTDHGFLRKVHDPEGGSFYGTNALSVERGAGRVLSEYVHRFQREERIPFHFGFSRIPGLKRWLEHSRKNLGGIELETAVLWYVHNAAKLVPATVWGNLGPCPDVDLPPVKGRDPVLTCHTREEGYGILALVPEFMEDPESRNYGVLLCSGPRMR